MPNNTSPIEIFIYSRKSRFTGAGDSIENQIEMCKEYAQRMYPSGCIFHVYEDEGFSAKNVDRPQWQQLMHDIELQPCHTLICYRLDRISRSVSDFSGIMDYLVDHQINFVSVSENFDTSTPMGRAMIYVASVFAQLERETITERVRDNKFRLYRTGRWQGGKAPAGYRSAKSFHQDDDGSRRHMYVLEDVPDEQAHIKLLFDKFTELGSLTALDSYLLENNIYSCGGNEYSNSTLRQILVNPIYVSNAPIIYDYLKELGCDIADDRSSYNGNCGLVSYGRTVTKGTKNTTRVRNAEANWIIATGYHQGLISPEQWLYVQQTIRDNGKKHPRLGTSNIALLAGLIKCKSCGAPMMVKGNRDSAGGEKLFYYVCSRKSRSHGKQCNATNIQGRTFDAHIVDTLKETFSDGGEVANVIDGSLHELYTDNINYQKQLRQLEHQINDNDTASMRLATKMAYTQSDAEDDALRRAIQNLGAEKNKLVQSQSRVRQAILSHESGRINADMMRVSIITFVNDFDQLPTEEQRSTLKNLIHSIIWDGENATLNLFPAIKTSSKKKE